MILPFAMVDGITRVALRVVVLGGIPVVEVFQGITDVLCEIITVVVPAGLMGAKALIPVGVPIDDITVVVFGCIFAVVVFKVVVDVLFEISTAMPCEVLMLFDGMKVAFCDIIVVLLVEETVLVMISDTTTVTVFKSLLIVLMFIMAGVVVFDGISVEPFGDIVVILAFKGTIEVTFITTGTV